MECVSLVDGGWVLGVEVETSTNILVYKMVLLWLLYLFCINFSTCCCLRIAARRWSLGQRGRGEWQAGGKCILRFIRPIISFSFHVSLWSLQMSFLENCMVCLESKIKNSNCFILGMSFLSLCQEKGWSLTPSRRCQILNLSLYNSTYEHHRDLENGLTETGHLYQLRYQLYLYLNYVNKLN